MKQSLSLIAIAAIFTASNVLGETSLTFTEYAKMKADAEVLGKYLSVLTFCQSNEGLEGLKTGLAMFIDISTLVPSDEAYDIILKSLEETGLPFDQLEKIDDVVRSSRSQTDSEFSPQAQAALSDPLSSAAQQVMSVCVDVVSRSSNFKNNATMPSDPIERMKFFRGISPIQ